MVVVELEPTLTSCIETEARKEYGATLRKLLAAEEDDPQLGEKAELLRLFLENTDFGQLRSEYEPHLLTGKRVRFTICLEGGAPRYKWEVGKT